MTNNTYHSAGVAPTDAINVTAASSGVHISGGEFRGGYTNDITDNGTSTAIGPFHTDNHAGASVVGSKLIIGQDTNSYLQLPGSSNPLWNADANDFIQYDRTANRWNFNIGSVVKARLEDGFFAFARLRSTLGTALVAGDFALSAGWGTTASVSAVSGTDQRFRITVTSAGTGQGANPTITLTFKDGTWTAAPFVAFTRNGGSQLSITQDWTTTATTLVVTWRGTPVAAETYTFETVVMG